MSMGPTVERLGRKFWILDRVWNSINEEFDGKSKRGLFASSALQKNFKSKDIEGFLSIRRAIKEKKISFNEIHRLIEKKRKKNMNEFIELEYNRNHALKRPQKRFDLISYMDSIDEVAPGQTQNVKLTPQQAVEQERLKLVNKPTNTRSVNNYLGNFAHLTPGSKEFDGELNKITDPKERHDTAMQLHTQLKNQGYGVNWNKNPTNVNADTYSVVKGAVKNSVEKEDANLKSTQASPPKTQGAPQQQQGQGAVAGQQVPALKQESFDDYLKMIRISPTKALDIIVKQENLNEFIEYLDTLTQDQIDEKVENRQNYYLFKYNLATKLGVYKKIRDRENPIHKIYGV